jgi:hypothetical protein
MREIKVGDRVVCMDNDGFSGILTVGKEYTVIGRRDFQTKIMLVMVDDEGEESNFLVNRFELVEWVPKRGEIVLVQGCGDWVEREFITDLGDSIDYRYICRDKEDQRKFCFWDVMKQKVEPKITELTMDEIAEKFGIAVEQLKIKK